MIQIMGSRLADLIIKLTSIKGLGFIIATVAMFQGVITFDNWSIMFGLIVAARGLEKKFAPRGK